MEGGIYAMNELEVILCVCVKEVPSNSIFARTAVSFQGSAAHKYGTCDIYHDVTTFRQDPFPPFL